MILLVNIMTSKTLDEIGINYGTDKSSAIHNYLNIYEKYLGIFRNDNIVVVEIGIYRGARSLKMWEEYFTVAKIYGIDIMSRRQYNNDRVQSIIANQEDRNSLLSAMNRIKQCDILIDDGGHTMKQQQVSFGYLFPFLNPNGIYVIEDLHTSLDSHWNNNPKTDKTTAAMLDKFCKDKVIDSDFMTPNECQYIQDNFSFCNIEKGKISDIAFIGKK